MFIPYLHIERFGNDAVQGIELGKCFVFSKVDGTNGSAWLDIIDDTFAIKAGSRTRELSLRADNQGFYAWLLSEHEKAKAIQAFLKDNPALRLYGEWLVPHTLKTYRQDAWNRFYVFDVWSELESRYLPYYNYKALLDEYGVEYVPCIAEMNNATYDQLIRNLDHANFLVQDGAGKGEGIVIKNYDFINRYGRVDFAKIVNNEFKAENQKKFGPSLIGGTMVEEKILTFLSQATIDKIFSKIVNENQGWNSKYIPRLLDTVFYDFIHEDLWDALKKENYPMVNFKTLKGLVIQKVKELRPELF